MLARMKWTGPSSTGKRGVGGEQGDLEEGKRPFERGGGGAFQNLEKAKGGGGGPNTFSGELHFNGVKEKRVDKGGVNGAGIFTG